MTDEKGRALAWTGQSQTPFDELYIVAHKMEEAGASSEQIDAFMRNASDDIIARMDAGEFGEPAPFG